MLLHLLCMMVLHLLCICNGHSLTWFVQGKTLDLIQLDQNDAAFR